MSVAPTGHVPEVHDVIGVGFGPSNLALAIALTEHNQRGDRPLTARFIERQPRFGWHRGMLIDDATMQVSFLKDLVTLRDPTSDFSFLCYLKSKGRLLDFINHKNLFPLRVEFHDYFEWAAERVGGLVDYGQEVVAVRPVRTDVDGAVRHLDVVIRTTGPDAPPAERVLRTRNLVLGVGLEARLPPGVTLSERVWHNRDLLQNVERLDGRAPSRFVVVGAGQSGAEATAFLHRSFPAAEVCSVFTRYGYSPADDSAFANRIFDPDAVDEYYEAPAPVRRMLLGYHANTNYSVVDVDLIDDLYRRAYQEKVLGNERLRLFNMTRLLGVEDTGAEVRATLESLATGQRTELGADVLICATGYQPADPVRLLGDLGGVCRRDPDGLVEVGRDYRLGLEGAGFAAGDVAVYLQGGTEHTHGLTSSLLSNTAVRVGEILASIADRRPRSPAANGAGLLAARNYAASTH